MASAEREVDLVVIGAGPVGENVADRAVKGGLETVIVESELVGGECSYWACMPSKALLRPVQVLSAARALPGAAEAVTGGLDVAAVLRRRDSFTSDWSDDGQVEWLESAGIDLLRGRGRLSGEREVTVTAEDGTTTVLRARHAVAVATGSVPSLPEIPGLREANPWSSREATSAKSVPESLAIIGGGVVAMEMATAYAALGADVKVIVRGGVLGSVEAFAGERVTDALRSQGVEILTDTETLRVERTADGVRIETSGGTVTAAELLVATGRRPATADLGLERIGLDPGKPLDTDDTLRVDGFDWLYAVGDVNGRVLLTHQGKYQARAAGDVIAARAKGRPVDDAPWGAHAATADHHAVPQVVFTEPEIAAVGPTAEEARAQGKSIRVVDYDLGGVAGASLSRDGYQGAARMIVDEDRGVMIGATFVGPDVAELVHAATTAVVGEVPVDRLWHAVPSYPTVSEIWLRLLEAYGRPASA
ncbi:dihydrolipoyl dehydrogenase family protein [Glycomyces algeriensis]|uniref:Oxidoreductase n=1 Tax=Glycomyces algeriensis TaxID=256037 RepID=A0A9W6LHD4_9ACTN|nr:NAD(P)/FAD-dependent oxidoreductase [Glycomyces algeriensis]MDA1365503.1 NAD(P)/FAD-dependent oxidoreductase [Glycomyces algeriensis]MDR7351189.1 dihydrolipoamide dehydrogenase [Glycomyces algeriensis]GLI43902.1 oxidoreductase [Glycomyces algeriensis]